jgi:hypothetical protein
MSMGAGADLRLAGVRIFRTNHCLEEGTPKAPGLLGRCAARDKALIRHR